MTINGKWNLQVDIMLHQSHAGITWPTLLVVVTNYVLVVGVWVLRQVPLNQIPGLVSREPDGNNSHSTYKNFSTNLNWLVDNALFKNHHCFDDSAPPEEDVDAVNVAAVQSDRVSALCGRVLETEEVVGHLRWAGHLAGTVQAQDQQVHHQAVVLDNERGELEPPDDTIGVGVVHILVRYKDKQIKHQQKHQLEEQSKSVCGVSYR